MTFAFWKKNSLKAVVFGAICCFLLWFAYRYYQTQNYRFEHDVNPVSEITEIKVPQPSLKPEPIYIYFKNPVANINKLQKDVHQDISMHPAVKGQWTWISDVCLSFQPEVSLIPDTEYEVRLAPELFSPNVRIKNKKFSFKSPAFQGQNTSRDFYENPQNGEKSIVASFLFNYPLNPQGIQDKVRISTVGGSTYGFTYKLDHENTMLHIISEPVKIKAEEDFATVSVEGVSNIYNKKPLKEKVSAEVKIPSSSTFFRVKSISSTIVHNRNHNDDPEQIAVVKFSTAVHSRDLNGNFDLYFTEKDCYNTRMMLSAQKNTGNLNLKKLDIYEKQTDGERLSTHLFKYDEIKPFGCLVAIVHKGLKSAEGYVLPQDVIEVVDYTGYPREVNIAAEGSVMARNGNHEAVFVTRGVTNLNVKVARIAEDNLNHLVTQTDGDFSHPYFNNYQFNENNISEVFEKNLVLNLTHPAQANYSSLDLNEYFKDKKGIFLIRAYGTSAENYYSNTDNRLIIITDLGIVVKDDVNGQHQVFVSDISKEKPVEGAQVEVLGKNGLPILSGKTDQNGLVVIPDFSDFKNDKEAVVYKVSKGGDLSFLPINQYDRILNLSRFDVGGQYDQKTGGYELKGSVFSDRGIYRPGETAYFGIVLRQNDLAVPAQLPLVVEVINPSGDLVATHDIKTDPMGLMSYEYQIGETASTGTYILDLYVKNKDNVKYFITSAQFKVDEFLPDNLKIKAQWQDVPTRGWTTAKNLTADVELNNLYGTPAADHEIKASYTLTPTVFRFKEYEGYIFLAPQADQNHRRETYQNNLPIIRTDKNGKAVLNVDVSQFEFGPYELRLFIDGFEAGGGRSVKTLLTALASENEFLIGWKADGSLDYLHKGSVHKIDFIALNNQLKTIDKDGLKLRVLRRETVSDLVEMPNGTLGYKMIQKETEISQKAWRIGAMHTEETLNTDEAGDFALQVETEDGQVLAKVEWSVVGASNIAGKIDKNANLDIKLNQKEYRTGDEIEMQIRAPYTGYGLITIERDQVYTYKWFKTNTLSAIEKIKLPDSVEGNAYVNVALFRSLDSHEIYMAPMSYAIAPVEINKDSRKLDIHLDVPQKIKSGNDLVIKYQTAENSQIILYGVNQGILQVARYKLPNLLDILLPKRALRVVTAQIMDLIMPDMNLLRTLSSSGGDDSYALALDKNLNPFARKNSKPVAFWSGVLKGGENPQEYRYAVPDDFNGEIKVMAVAVSENRFGSTEKGVKAHGDFALLPSGPLNVAPQDEFVISLNVGNMVENSGTEYPVEVRVDHFDGFDLIGASTQSVHIAENGEKTVRFRFKALAEIGAKELNFSAQSLKNNAIRSKTSYSISIRPSAPYSTQFMMGHARSEYVLNHIEKLYPEYRIQQISASSSPLVLVSGLFKYLDKFPHYCTEQTVSKAFPATELLFKYPELVKNVDVYALFNDAVAKLQERQTIDGGFSAWSSSAAPADEYASIYATHFLIKARNYGFNVPQGMLARALAYCSDKAGQAPRDINDFVPAYATYVLTLNGSVTSNYLLKFEEFYKKTDGKKRQNNLATSFMAASYQMLQDRQKAYYLIGRYKNSDDPLGNAIHAYILATHFPELFADSGSQQIKTLLKGLADGNWTTSIAAWSTLALAATDGSENDQNIRFNGQKAEQLTPFPTVDFTLQTQKLEVTSKVPFYYVVSQLGFLRNEDIKARTAGMEVQKNIYNQKGEAVTSAKIGEELTVVINCRGLLKENIQDVAVVDLLAGGFEVVGNSLQTPWNTDMSEIREDRVVTSMTVLPQNSEISYKVKAIASGSFVVPPVFASALYQPLVRANSDISTIQINE